MFEPWHLLLQYLGPLGPVVPPGQRAVGQGLQLLLGLARENLHVCVHRYLLLQFRNLGKNQKNKLNNK